MPTLQPDVQVTTVEVTPSELELAVGETGALEATARDGNGTIVTGQVITWTSSDEEVGLVDQAGIVTAMAEGSATITATAEGESGTAAVTVSVPVGGAPIDTLFMDGFESGVLGGWDDVYETQTGNHAILADEDLARSGSRLLRIRYPQGENGGGAATTFIQPGVERLYVSYFVLIPNDFEGGTKLLLLRGSREDNIWSSFGKGSACPQGDDFFVTNIVTRNTSSLPMRFYTYYPGMQAEPGGAVCYGRYGDDASPPAQYFGSLDLSKGVWHQLEFEVELNDPGQANGAQRFWIDGILKGEWVDLVFRSTADLMLNGVTLETSMNEVSSSPQTQEIYIDDLLVGSQRPS